MLPTRSSATERCTITNRRSVCAGVDRRVPAAANTMARTARSRSADGVSDGGVFAAKFQAASAEPLGDPWSACWPSATVSGRGDHWRTRSSSTAAPSYLAAPVSRRSPRAPRRHRPPHVDQRLTGPRRPRWQLGRFPIPHHHGVPATNTQPRLPRPQPRPESLNAVIIADPRRAGSRFPSADARPLGGDGGARKLTDKPDGKLADVRHLLSPRRAPRGDLARLEAPPWVARSPCDR